MKIQTALMIRILMNRYYQGAPEAFLQGLNSEGAAAVLSTENSSQSPEQAAVDSTEAFRSKIHYSWLIPTLESFSAPMRGLLMEALPIEVQEHLSSKMKVSSPVKGVMAEVAKPYFLTLLYGKLRQKGVLPRSFLPPSPISFLLEMSKGELTELVDLLGLYDLADELRLIVDKKIITGIYSCLSPTKRKFLRLAMHQKEKISSATMGLKNWQGNSAQLKATLHHRGLLRFGYSLSGQHPDLLWHIVHRLDIGRGKILEGHYSKKEIPSITSVLLQQVVATHNFMSKQSAG